MRAAYREIFTRSKKRAQSPDGRLVGGRWTMVQLPKGTVSGVLTGRNLPSADVLASLLYALDVAERDMPRWITALERIRTRRSKQGVPELSDLGHLEWNALGTPIERINNPFALEVHRAIDINASATLPELPSYLSRHHDQDLGSRISEAVNGTSTLVVLVGGSSTGKTRACWEAIKDEELMPPYWRLWHPFDPARAEAVLEGLERVAPCTVIWLNEAQHYLITSGSDRGERVAARLRTLLADPDRAPVLVLATMWPEYWGTLTQHPRPTTENPHEQARELLTGHDISVPETFSEEELNSHRRKIEADPRLVEAAKGAEDGELIQYLAGAPALVARYQNATEAAKALITAAMDIRRLGHGVAIPKDLLHAGTAAYLTNRQWRSIGRDKRWFDSALDYAEERCHGDHRPLSRIQPRPDEPETEHQLYQLADYLDQTGRQARGRVIIPTGLWQALVTHVQDSTSAVAIGHAAEERKLHCHAIPLLRRAADAGNGDAARRLADLLVERGEVEEAMAVLRQLADAGSGYAADKLAGLLVERGDVEGLQQLADAGKGGRRCPAGRPVGQAR
jgi:hypothetical protein